ncbi:hypothetical protein BABINDRAFT_89438 [Babjeviella inositovora NRRL Y-12698]|uniref:Uncharacterized protein n=1 Tax=Babjeviella inositovora NRRL Y-12698 TaxID=984486 RepID=A0A1E3QKY3_9ASCO|nr:uncharacterized protein BABINDRAFT_89438 [Babjeviella inositovora NRRL Y-12698]ODQ78278.1 hypothetical protein BABINDRAFT_89438 [Babjeviella inositovora NRRL Y-12698]
MHPVAVATEPWRGSQRYLYTSCGYKWKYTRSAIFLVTRCLTRLADLGIKKTACMWLISTRPHFHHAFLSPYSLYFICRA